MRPGQQNKRMRGRGRKAPNGFNRVYESNGPDVKVRGTAAHIAEKYVTLARDAQSSGDPVAGEAYLQHAEHYFRIIAAMQGQVQAQQQQYGQDDDDDGDDEQPRMNGNHQNGYSGQQAPHQRGQSDDDDDQGEQDVQQAQGDSEENPRQQRHERGGERNQDKAQQPDEGERGPRGPRRRRRPNRDAANGSSEQAQAAEGHGGGHEPAPVEAIVAPANEPAVVKQKSTEPAA